MLVDVDRGGVVDLIRLILSMPESSSVLSFCCCCWVCWGLPFASTEVNEIGPSNGKEIVSNSEEVRSECGGEHRGSKCSTLSMKIKPPLELVRVSVTFGSVRCLGLVCCELAALPKVVKLT